MASMHTCVQTSLQANTWGQSDRHIHSYAAQWHTSQPISPDCSTWSHASGYDQLTCTSAHAQGRAGEDLRDAPYLLPEAEIARRAAEAWQRGATEVCIQGGIHPDFTGAAPAAPRCQELLALRVLHRHCLPEVRRHYWVSLGRLVADRQAVSLAAK